jgi:hypothetical protein
LPIPPTHTAASVFDKSIRGHTDQFICKIRKPKGQGMNAMRNGDAERE